MVITAPELVDNFRTSHGFHRFTILCQNRWISAIVAPAVPRSTVWKWKLALQTHMVGQRWFAKGQRQARTIIARTVAKPKGFQCFANLNVCKLKCSLACEVTNASCSCPMPSVKDLRLPG